MKERQGQTIADLFREGQTPKAIFKVTGFPVPIPSLFNEGGRFYSRDAFFAVISGTVCSIALKHCDFS